MHVFRDANHDFLLALVKAVKRVSFDAGTVVQKTSEKGIGAYFVRKGQLLATAPQGRPATLRESDVFGLETLHADSMPMQQVQAGTDIELLLLPLEAAATLGETFPYLLEVAQARHLALAQNGGSFRGGAPASNTDVVRFSASPEAAVAGGSTLSGDLPLDAELLSERLGLMQASIVAMGREMRSKIDGMDKQMFEYMERKDRQHKQALNQMSSRIEQLASACEHPTRASTRSGSRVAFAPRGGGSSSAGAATSQQALPAACNMSPSSSLAASMLSSGQGRPATVAATGGLRSCSRRPSCDDLLRAERDRRSDEY